MDSVEGQDQVAAVVVAVDVLWPVAAEERVQRAEDECDHEAHWSSQVLREDGGSIEKQGRGRRHFDYERVSRRAELAERCCDVAR